MEEFFSKIGDVRDNSDMITETFEESTTVEGTETAAAAEAGRHLSEAVDYTQKELEELPEFEVFDEYDDDVFEEPEDHLSSGGDLSKLRDFVQDTLPVFRRASSSASSVSIKLKSTCSSIRETFESSGQHNEEEFGVDPSVADACVVKPVVVKLSVAKPSIAKKPESQQELELANGSKNRNPSPSKMRRGSQNQKKELMETMTFSIDKYLEDQAQLRAIPFETAVAKDLSEVELKLLEYYQNDKKDFEKWSNAAKWLAERKKFHEDREILISRYYSVFFGLIASKYLENPIFVFDIFVLDKLMTDKGAEFWETSYVEHVLGSDVVHKFTSLYESLST